MARDPEKEYVSFPCTADFKKRLEQLAEREGRSLSSQIRIMLSDWMTQRPHWREEPNWQVADHTADKPPKRRPE